MKKSNIYVTRKIPEAGLELIRKECGGFDINPANRALSRKELLNEVRGREAVSRPLDRE